MEPVATTRIATTPAASAPAWPRAAAAPLTQSLPEQIAAQLSARIVAGTYAPGQRVLEQTIAGEFAVSRGPVREALRLLEKDGLVAILARRGAQVTKPSIAEVREIFDIRAVLNGVRDRGIAEDPERGRLLPALEAEVALLEKYARDTKHGNDYVDAVFRINRMLTAATRNHRLQSMLDSLALQTLRYSRLGLATPERRRQSVEHWQKLVRAIRSGDGEAAQQIAEQRVRDSRDGAIRALEKQGAEKPLG